MGCTSVESRLDSILLTVVVDVVQAHDRLFDLDRGHSEGLVLHHGHVHDHVRLVVLVVEGFILRLQNRTSNTPKASAFSRDIRFVIWCKSKERYGRRC